MAAILNRAVLARALLALTAIGFAGCTTYGTGVNPGAQTLHDVGGLIDIGGGHKAAIDYKPRPPLAAPPPGVAPPPPGSGASVASAGDWPKDPDAAAKAAGKRPTYDAKTDALYNPGVDIPVQHEDHKYLTKRGTQYEDAAASAYDDKAKELKTRKLMKEAKSAV